MDDQTLFDLLTGHLADAGVSEEVASVIRAAYAGEDQLRSALAGVTVDARPEDARPHRLDPLFLESLVVRGFRGVASAPALQLQPVPGLTLVVGRNGSGKSSLAEALELVLTGDSARWAGQSAIFREGWRNLHQSSPCQIEVTLRADGSASPMKITRSWADSATDPDAATIDVTGDLNTEGWRSSLDAYRPFLTANDLGRLITSTPSSLFDALSPILGIEPVTAADKRLVVARKEIDERVSAVKTRLAHLRVSLSTVDDDRAQRASAILGKRVIDLAALDDLLADSAAAHVDPRVVACQKLTAVELPAVEDVRAAAHGLRLAARRLDTVTASQAGSADRAAKVLEAALKWHDAHGDGNCPVCGVGRLDLGWHGRAYAEVNRLRDEAEAAREARRQLDAARQGARMLVTVGRMLPAGTLDQATTLSSGLRDELRRAVEAWESVNAEVGTEELAEHLDRVYPDLHAAFEAVRASAADWLRQRHEAWRERAAELHMWLVDKRAAVSDEIILARIKAARDILKGAIEKLREQRLAPFAAQSQQIWEELRQESNVELSGMKLAGAATRRKVSFPATVDGTATSAMAVMSQGELQALGLAVFLPRACAPESPFRFVIIDDPVQSMDPSKVDGLARVLAELSSSRQVLVFTHDNRLAEAVRRLGITATIWEVVRRRRSAIEIRKNDDPIKRYLDDAWALAKTGELDEDIRRPVVAGFCRAALEAACHERIRRQRISAGEPHGRVERLIDEAHTLTQTFALGLFQDRNKGGQVLPTLNRVYGGWAATVFKACQEGVHGTASVALDSLVDSTQRLAQAVRVP